MHAVRLLGWAALALLALAVPAAAQPAQNVCLDCHSAMDAPLAVTPEQFSADIHAQKGLGCVDCHGGDPTNPDRAMTAAAGFRKLDRKRIPELCGSCHGDAAKMRQFNPSLRTDQLAQYRTSVHGKKLATGDTHVAVCTDCHGLHGIRPASDTRSTVHPLNVANTCKRCHGDREYMKSYGIPTDQFAGYSSSVHFEAMTARGDLSAPTCTTCHGNHGAAPPGVAAVENVCSTCHVFQAQMFDTSPHKAAFAAAGMPGCVTCHSNHQIKHPDDSMIGTSNTSVCVSCHSDGDPGFTAAATMHTQLSALEKKIGESRALLDRAAHSGIEVSESQLELAQAVDALTKSRVSIHSFNTATVGGAVKEGDKVADKTYQAGVAALRERHYRRVGMTASLVAILAVLVGLALYIREVENGKKT